MLLIIENFSLNDHLVVKEMLVQRQTGSLPRRIHQLYLCNSELHSELFDGHQLFKVKENLNRILTGFCKMKFIMEY